MTQGRRGQKCLEMCIVSGRSFSHYVWAATAVRTSRENQTFSRRSKGNCPEPLSSLFGDGKQISSKHSLMTQSLCVKVLHASPDQITFLSSTKWPLFRCHRDALRPQVYGNSEYTANLKGKNISTNSSCDFDAILDTRGPYWLFPKVCPLIVNWHLSVQLSQIWVGSKI